MIRPIDVTQLSAPAQKIAGPGAPPKLQEMAAKGIAPGVKPAELVSLLVVLSLSEHESVKAAAQKTLAQPSDQLLNAALSGDLEPAAIHALARGCLEKREALDKLLAMPRIDMETVEEVARYGSESITELIATNEDRLLKHPRIIDSVHTKTNAHAGNTGNAKQSCKVIIPATTADASHFYSRRCFCFKDNSGVIIKPSC